MQKEIVNYSIISCRGDTVKPLKKSVSITLDMPVLEQIQALAEGEDRSLSSYINLVLKAHLEDLEKKKPQQ